MSQLDSLGIDASNDTPWLRDRTVLLGIVGSRAYGIDDENSDTDYRGVVVPPKDYFLGLKSFNEYNTTGSKNWKLTQGQDDFCILHINKFILSCARGRPRDLDLLYLKPEFYVYKHELADLLDNARHAFISKYIKLRLVGLTSDARLQIHKTMNRPEDAAEISHQAIINKHSYDTKLAAYCVLWLSKGIHLLKTGEYEVYARNAAHLKDIRAGKYSFREVEQEMDELSVKLEELYQTSNAIPDRVDAEDINNWLVYFNSEAVEVLGEEEYLRSLDKKGFKGKLEKLLHYLT